MKLDMQKIFKNDKLIETGNKRKKAVRENNENIKYKESNYVIFDSRLQDGEDSFAYSFHELTDGHDLKTYIETKLKQREGKAIGVEFGGIAKNLFGDFSDGFFSKSVGIALVDYRDLLKSDKLERIECEDGREHNIILANILNDETYDVLDSVLGGQKADLIFERMIAGLTELPKNPFLIMRIFQKWYQMLNEDGLMFIQMPLFIEPLIDRWEDLLKREYEGRLEIKVNLRGSFRLNKLKNAPEELPILSTKEVSETYKEFLGQEINFKNHAKQNTKI